MFSVPRSLVRLRSVYPLIYNGARFRSSLPMNTVVIFVPQQEAWVVERMGKFHQICEPGLNFLIPIVDRVKYVQSLKEIAIDIPKQSAVTSDNVTLAIDGVLYLRVVDPYKASYGVEDPEFAITQLAQTTMRSEIGKITLDTVFKERETLNIAIVEAINKAGLAWGITCLRYEIRDIKLPERVQEALSMQVEAERRKRAVVLESEGRREAEINVAEGEKQAKILSSEAQRIEQINKAQGESAAIQAVASAKAAALERISKALANKGGNAASLVVAEQYVKAFSELAKKSNTLILPADTGNVSSLVAQSMAIYKNITDRQVNMESTSKKDKDDNFLAEYNSDIDEDDDEKP
ncbi:stomatin-like protein 2, mitochondrial [Tetranychus urticae]|uniref:Band 7 domain-containing protein n=1 Tax=Tetranychus urticae TaxID=32264 RepID=T1K807_TETUR|nr:stomatin-like protein 2, mitochondrial [Tetranychus urticae]